MLACGYVSPATATGIAPPPAIGTVEFVPNEPAGRKLADRMLWSQPHRQAHSNAADLPPERAHYWTLNPAGYSARFETTADGTVVGLILSQWEGGRISTGLRRSLRTAHR
jgi:hypothetical protein